MSLSPLAAGPGPAMFLGASIMSFALPYAAFIVSATVLFLLFRSRHSLPRLKYLPVGTVTSVTTHEPGPVPAPAAARSSEPPESAESAAEPAAGSAVGSVGESAESAENPASPEEAE